MPEPSADLQQKIQKLQAMAQQLQAIGQQRGQYEAMKSEGEQALAALEETADDAAVYRSVGGLLLADSKAAAVTRLTDEQETMELRIKRLTTQETELTASLTKMQADLQAEFGQK